MSSQPEAHPGNFKKASRLLKHAEFERVYKSGRRHFSGNMTVFFLPHGEAPGPARPRVGFTVSRALGGAVVRNRIRRRLREAARANLAALTTAVDVVINPRKSALHAEFALLVDEVRRAFQVIARTAVNGRKR